MIVEEKELDEQIVEDANPQDTDPDKEITAAEEDSTEKNQDSAEPDDKKEKKKSFLGKDKKEKANKLQEKIDELEDKVKRQMAEFDNFRKRSEKEKSAMFETGAKSVVEKILPVVDNFERGLAVLSEEEMKQPFAEGMNMVYKQLIAELEKLEVKPIEAVGCEFNPELHNAVMQVESEEYASGIIAQELQKGYTYRDSVVRHSMVAVVQ
ncbi:MAG: nucleotide exchange factor GrpE [Lachnospiraceae bacterium]|nr:nucleotide exchange factor GrpE [Lachnospiraceae bacterium]